MSGETQIKKLAYEQTFLLTGLNGFTHVVKFNTDGMTDKEREHRDLLFKCHLEGHTVNLTKDGTDEGPAIREVTVEAVHSRIYEVKEEEQLDEANES